MPILQKDADVSPYNLLEEDCHTEGRWFALHTKPRQEKTLMRRLDRMEKAFCGLLIPRRGRTPAGRVITSHIPLFPGYVFLNGTEDDRYDAVCSGSVIRVLEVVEGAQLREDLRQIRGAVLSGVNVTRLERLQAGQAVRVLTGPLAGKTGVFVRRKGQGRLLLTLSFIQQAAVVEIDEADIEAV